MTHKHIWEINHFLLSTKWNSALCQECLRCPIFSYINDIFTKKEILKFRGCSNFGSRITPWMLWKDPLQIISLSSMKKRDKRCFQNRSKNPRNQNSDPRKLSHKLLAQMKLKAHVLKQKHWDHKVNYINDVVWISFLTCKIFEFL